MGSFRNRLDWQWIKYVFFFKYNESGFGSETIPKINLRWIETSSRTWNKKRSFPPTSPQITSDNATNIEVESDDMEKKIHGKKALVELQILGGQRPTNERVRIRTLLI